MGGSKVVYVTDDNYKRKNLQDKLTQKSIENSEPMMNQVANPVSNTGSRDKLLQNYRGAVHNKNEYAIEKYIWNRRSCTVLCQPPIVHGTQGKKPCRRALRNTVVRATCLHCISWTLATKLGLGGVPKNRRGHRCQRWCEMRDTSLAKAACCKRTRTRSFTNEFVKVRRYSAYEAFS